MAMARSFEVEPAAATPRSPNAARLSQTHRLSYMSSRMSFDLSAAMTSQINLNRATLMGEEERDDSSRIDTSTAVATFIGAIVGAAVLVLPQLPKKGGVVATSAFSIISALCATEAGLVFFAAREAHNNAVEIRGGNKIRTFEDFGREGMGAAGATMVRVSVIVWFFGLCSGFVILLAQQFQSLVGEHLDMRYRHCVLVAAVPLWCLAMQRDVGTIARLMPIASAAGMATCFLIIGSSFVDAKVWRSWPQDQQRSVHHLMPPPGAGVQAMGAICATLSGAYSAVAAVPSVSDKMERPREFPHAWVITMVSVGILYTGVMLFGHYGYGTFVQESIAESMRYHPATAGEAFGESPREWTGRPDFIRPNFVCVFVVVNLILGYPLNMMCIFISVQSSRFGQAALQVGTAANYAMRSALCGLTFLVAFFMEHFSVVYALFAAVCSPMQGVFFVLFFARSIQRQNGAAEYPAWRRVCHACMVAWGVFCLVFGFIDSAGKMVAAV